MRKLCNQIGNLNIVNMDVMQIFVFFFLILINFFPISNMLEKEVESGKGV